VQALFNRHVLPMAKAAIYATKIGLPAGEPL